MQILDGRIQLNVNARVPEHPNRELDVSTFVISVRTWIPLNNAVAISALREIPITNLRPVGDIVPGTRTDPG